MGGCAEFMHLCGAVRGLAEGRSLFHAVEMSCVVTFDTVCYSWGPDDVEVASMGAESCLSLLACAMCGVDS